MKVPFFKYYITVDEAQAPISFAAKAFARASHHVASMSMSSVRDRHVLSLLDHWIWVLPFLLMAVALSLYQADAFPPSVDEFVSMLDAGWLDGGYNPAEIVDSLMQHSPSHMPGYSFVLGLWGSLTAHDIAVARYLGILLYMLILAQIYRLAGDFIAPAAGVFALVIVMSSAFFNFYIAHARLYTTFLLLSCHSIWLYLRLISRRRDPSDKDYFALVLTVFALVMTHLFSATLLFTFGLYHLFFAPKNRRWLKVALAITIAVVISAPMIALVLSRYSSALIHLGTEGPNGIEAIALWLGMMLNQQPGPLLIISLGGFFFGMRTGMFKARPLLIMLACFLVTLMLASDFASLVRPQALRHQLDGWALLVLVAAAGHYALFRWKPLLGILLVIWVITGLSFQRSTNWWFHIDVRAPVFRQPPFQVLSRLAIQAEPTPYIIGYPFDDFLSYALFSDGPPGARRAGITQGRYYFGLHGIAISITNDRDEFAAEIRQRALHSPSIWSLHEDSLDSALAQEASAILRDSNYSWCAARQIGLNTIVNQYMWTPLRCQTIADPAIYKTEFAKYEIFGVGLNEDADAALFIDRWTSIQDFESSDYNMSYQLIREDWTNVSQLDLPLVDEDNLRQFSIDVAQVPPGQYRLMLILYHKATGERLVWADNPGYVPEMLELGSVTISDKQR